MELTRLQQLAGLTAVEPISLFEAKTFFEGLEDKELLLEAYNDFASAYAELGLLLEDITLTHAQIDKLFRDIEDHLNSDKADVSNRNYWGKGLDSIRARFKELFNWKKGKNKAGIVKNYDKIMTGFEQQLNKANIMAKVKPEAIRIIDTIKDYGNKEPIAQKALVQIGTALVAVQSSSSKVQQTVIPALSNQTQKLLSDETGINSLVELLFNEGAGNLAEHLAFLDAWNKDTTLADFAKEQPEMVKAIRKYPGKVAEASAKLMNENVVCTIFAEQKGEKSWTAAFKRFSSEKNKLFVWQNGVYYAGDLKDIATATFGQIAKKVEKQPDAASVGKVNVVEQLDENFIGDFFRNLKDKVKGWQAKKGDTKSDLTHIVTYDSISRAWFKAGKPRGLDELETFLADYLTKAYGKSHHLVIRKMLDEFFNDLRSELEDKGAAAEDSAETDSSEDNGSEESKAAEKESGSNKEPEGKQTTTSKEDSSSTQSGEPLSGEEKTLLKHLYLAVKNGKGDVVKDLASHMHKRNVLYKALAKVYAPHGVKLEETAVAEHINGLLLEDFRNKAGLGRTGFSELIKVLERETKYY